ncbi:hypothetical protein [Streptomyces sp. NPDC002845]
MILVLPPHQHLCWRHQRWTRSTHDIPFTHPPVVIPAQRRLDQLARRHRQLGQALDLARKIVEEWSSSGMPIDLGSEWTNRLDRIEKHPVSKKIPAEDRHHLAAFPEIVVLANLILNPPNDTIDPKELYLATTAELSRRFARIYTTLGTQAPSTGASASTANKTSAKARSFENNELQHPQTTWHLSTHEGWGCQGPQTPAPMR